jgi:hypothetical protein
MHSSIDFFRDVRNRIDAVYKQMIMTGAKDILIWGDGELAELSYLSMRGLPINLIGVIDCKKKENGFFGYNIYSFKDVPNLEYDAILIASFSKKEMQKIEELGIDKNRVYSL